MSRLAVLSSALVLLACAPCLSAQDEEPQAQQMLSLVETSRSELRKGEFQGKGVRLDDPNSNTTSSLSFKCSFDHERGLFRFDTDGDTMISLASSGLLNSNSSKSTRESYSKNLARRKTSSRILLTPEYATEWYAFGESVDDSGHATTYIELRDRSTALTGLGSVMFLPEVAGLMEQSSVGSFDSIPALMKTYRARASKTTLEHAGEEAIIVLDTHGKIQRRITVDVQAGYTISGMELVELDSGGKPLDFPRKTSSATWEKRDSAWIPTSIQTRYLHGDGRAFGVDLTLNWTSVNSELADPKIFEYQHLDGVWDGVQVVERRDSARDIVGSFTGGEFRNVQAAESLAVSAKRSGENGRTRAIFVVSALVIFALVAYSLATLRHRSSP